MLYFPLPRYYSTEGPLGSLRLAAMRDGQEDFELLQVKNHSVEPALTYYEDPIFNFEIRYYQ